MTQMDKVKVGGTIFRIERTHDLRDVNGEKVDGRISYSKSLITLDNELSPQAEMETLWHELFHAILIHAGLKASETMVDALAYGTLMILTDNPQLVETPKQ